MWVNRYEGSLLGLALGDAMGAPYEGGALERLLWRLIGRTPDGAMRWTDDTAMSIDLAESLLACGGLDAGDAARCFAASYRWSRGYGPGAAKILKRIRGGMHWQQARCSVYREGSFGNGGAMRAAVIGLYFAGQPQELRAASDLAASITHAHPLAIEGARLIAVATAAALSSRDPHEIFSCACAASGLPQYQPRLALAADWLAPERAISPADVRKQLGNGIAALDSTVTALLVALRHLPRPFAELLDFVRRCAGDVDSIGAMAGAIWGAANGAEALPPALLQRLEQQARLRQLAAEIHASGLHWSNVE